MKQSSSNFLKVYAAVAWAGVLAIILMYGF